MTHPVNDILKKRADWRNAFAHRLSAIKKAQSSVESIAEPKADTSTSTLSANDLLARAGQQAEQAEQLGEQYRAAQSALQSLNSELVEAKAEANKKRIFLFIGLAIAGVVLFSMLANG